MRTQIQPTIEKKNMANALGAIISKARCSLKPGADPW